MINVAVKSDVAGIDLSYYTKVRLIFAFACLSGFGFFVPSSRYSDLFSIFAMLLISFAASLLRAATSNGLTKIPSELIIPIVSHIGSFDELVALNTTSKAMFPHIRPIFDFASACQVPIRKIWPNDQLLIETDKIIDMKKCSTQLMRYSFLYKRISFEGHPNSTVAMFNEVKSPLHSLVDVTFRSLTLNQLSFKKVLQSIKFGSIFLDLFGQEVDQDMINQLTVALDLRKTACPSINGINFNVMNQALPVDIFANLFRTLPFSDLKRLTILGRLYPKALTQLAVVLPKSRLSSFEYSMPFVAPSNDEMRAIGSALVNTPTMKEVVFRFFPSTKDLMESIVAGLPSSNIEKLEIIYGFDSDSAVALIKTLPPSMKSLKLSSNRIKSSTIVNLIGAISRSNVHLLNLIGNNARLNSTDILQIVDYVEQSQLEILNLSENYIGAVGKMILATVDVGKRIII